MSEKQTLPQEKIDTDAWVVAAQAQHEAFADLAQQNPGDEQAQAAVDSAKRQLDYRKAASE